jgi:hypothetical protein
VLPAEGDPARPQLLLHVVNADLLQFLRPVLAEGVDGVARQDESFGIVWVLLGNGNVFAQPHFGTPRHQLALPLHGPRRRGLGHHADGHVQHQSSVGVVALAHLHQLRVQLRAHLRRQQVGPAHVRQLPQVARAPRQELLGALRAREEALDGAGPVRDVAPPGDQRQVVQRLLLFFDGGDHLPAQRADPREEASLPVLLPVRAPARPRAVGVRAIVAVLERRRFRAGGGGRPPAPRVPTLKDRRRLETHTARI